MAVTVPNTYFVIDWCVNGLIIENQIILFTHRQEDVPHVTNEVAT